ncbi:DUF929 family protein [Actinopolymorpha rutila]|uniref:Thiol-disulfide isomerase/thioredoxin n=1 Tax=Actinopolymorpha rutila TaxID=446787 RepID=A0A852ZNB5_9ACTN|nr:DUF929 family protein [Actinopolymorpha rutila]NYH93388.1 thiol-disulfide isomerase/thioredoxin [Actinopolymorpha rutila]
MARPKGQQQGEPGRSTRARVAALRAEQARQAQRRRLAIVGGAVAVVLVVIAAIVGIYLTRGSGTSTQQAGGSGAQPSVEKAVTTVPAETLAAVGKGSVQQWPQSVKAKPVTAGGKPKVLYVGAEYCPYCAAERWSMVMALSRFGSFKNLGTTHSASEDVFPNTATFSFHGAGYSSRYLSFVGKELTTNQRSGNGYKPLDKLTAAEQSQLNQVTGGGQLSFPTVDFGGRYLVSGSQYDPSVLQGKTMQQIASALKDPNDPVAKAVDGSANTITATLCKLTGNQPGNVCGTSTVKQLQRHLDAAS